MKRNETKKLSITFGLIVMSTALVMLALLTLSGQAQVENNSDLFGYPSPTDDIGYPIYEPYPQMDNYWLGWIVDVYGYPIDTGYPVEVASEPTEWQAEIEEVREVIENIQPFEKSKVYQTWQQIKEIVKVYFGKMIKFAR